MCVCVDPLVKFDWQDSLGIRSLISDEEYAMS